MDEHRGGIKVQIQALRDGDRGWVATLLQSHWGSVRIASRGQIHEADQLPGFVAWQGDEPVGLLTYSLEGPSCEIVSLDSLVEGIGVGTALIGAAKAQAIGSGCKRLWLITTNDNTPAMDFYRRRGFTMVAIHKDAVATARKTQPEIPETGYGGIPIRDEVEFELRLDDPGG
jgi:GNAT superfamily N-acetyltransferase